MLIIAYLRNLLLARSRYSYNMRSINRKEILFSGAKSIEIKMNPTYEQQLT